MATGTDQLEGFKQKYGSVLRTIENQQVRLQNVHVQDGKLLIRGVAPSEDAKNKVWDQIKLVNPKYDDIIVDITVNPSAAPQSTGGAPQTGQQKTYTVQAGDTLSKIAKEHYGNANEYNKIFEANRDKLSSPDLIKPGQVLVIP